MNPNFESTSSAFALLAAGFALVTTVFWFVVGWRAKCSLRVSH